MMRIIRIFIAGAKNLRTERLCMKALANDLDAKYSSEGIPVVVNMVSYENFGEHQSAYNNFIKEKADMAIFIVDGRLGEKTEAELRLACQTHKSKGKPEVLTFLHSFSERTKDIEYVETVINSVSDKYYVDYDNTEDLLAKAKERIDTFVTKSLRAATRDKTRLWMKKTFWAFTLMTAFLLGIALYVPLSSPNLLVLDVSEPPSILVQSGIGKEFIEQQMADLLPELGNETDRKITDILSHFTTDVENGPDLFSNTALNDIEIVTHGNRFTRKIRRILGKKDVTVSVKIVEKDSVFEGKIVIEDWHKQRHAKTIEENISAFPSKQDCAMSIIKKGMWFVARAYSPVVSALYDYENNAADDYNGMNNPWKENLFRNTERIDLLEKAIADGSPDSSYCRLVIGNIFDKAGTSLADVLFLQRACYYYESFARDCPQFAADVKNHIKDLGSLSGPSPRRAASIPETLMNNGTIPEDTPCRQLIVISNQTKHSNGGTDYYKADLSTFEKQGDKWVKMPMKCKVNVGTNGIAEAGAKVEGDKKTPSGFYPLPFTFGRNHDVKTKMEFRVLNRNHVWVCDTVSDDYNQWVEDIYGDYRDSKQCEHLFNIMPRYEYAIVVGYNCNPVVKGMGSAIFMHVEKDSNIGTAGCIAMPKKMIISLIKWLKPAMAPHVYISRRME